MQKRRRLTIAMLALAALPLLGGCGFTPLYATTAGEDGAPPLRRINLAQVSASQQMGPVVTRAFERRLARPGDTQADYDLFLNVNDRAQRLAVQIDSSVTRYNYRVRASYALTPRGVGRASETLRGSAESIVSFNIVNSQYSTLFAENSAREKAARDLVEQVERDILLKMNAEREGEAAELAREAEEAENARTLDDIIDFDDATQPQ